MQSTDEIAAPKVKLGKKVRHRQVQFLLRDTWMTMAIVVDRSNVLMREIS